MYNYSFIDILTRDVEFEQKKYNFTGIRIPMIQRDYAQGRESESELSRRCEGASDRRRAGVQVVMDGGQRQQVANGVNVERNNRCNRRQADESRYVQLHGESNRRQKADRYPGVDLDHHQLSR